MRVGVNAIGLYPGKIGGAEQYLRNIIEELGNYNDIEVYIFLNGSAMSEFAENCHRRLICIDMTYNHNVQLKGYIEFYKIDVWFCPFFHLIPADCGIPSITTIFDIQQDYYPQNFDKKVLRNRIKLTQETVNNTDLILTISEFSKQTIIEKYRIQEDKIKITYLDADSSFNDPIDSSILETIKHKLPEKYILYPANMWPHKNHIKLIKGFAIAKKKQETQLKLVFTGAQERETPQIVKTIEECGLRDEIKYLGYIPQEQMKYVFKCATMLAFPSLFEGFGIPLVEAMASGLPIICSKSSCIPEIVGDSAILFDGEDPEDIANAILMANNDLQLRQKLIQKGIDRRKLFSWRKCAKETVKYIRETYYPREDTVTYISSHPKVSIITPSFNQGEFIRDTIESVLNQTYDNIEYLVMDGGSTDDTVSILKEYGDRIIWVSEQDEGQADAVNKGLKIASGEIIGWLNSDDTYYPDAVEKAVNAFLEHPDYDMIYGEGDYTNKQGEIIGRYNTHVFDYGELANDCLICQPTAFFTKEIVEKSGRLKKELQLCMDYELWMRIGKIGKILYIPECLATSRMYEDNKTLSRRGEVYKEVCHEVKLHYGYVPHNWLVGYATFLSNRYSKIKRKYFYLLLFIRYNFLMPKYFFQCLKPYVKMRLKNIETSQISTPFYDKYADGWIAKEYHTRVICKKEENELLIQGRHLLSFDQPLVISIEAAGKSKSFCIKDHGKFSLSLNYDSIKSDEYLVKIQSNQTVVPAKINSESADARELSVLIDNIEFKKTGTNDPLVSIITPSFNQGEYIRATIESVIKQDYPNIEYIVIDGGSTDSTLSILEEYKTRLSYISEPDKGQSNAINKGFRMANGEIIAWLNSDDVYEPGCIRKAVDTLRKNPDAAMVYGDGYIIDKEGNKTGPFIYSRSFNLWALTHIWDYIMQPTTFFRKSDVESVGFLDENLNWTMDWDLWIKLALRKEVVYIPDYLACSREYKETKTSTGKDKRLAEILKVMQRATGEEKPYGYEIYSCSEMLSQGGMTEEEKEAVLHKLECLILLQPTPNSQGFCTKQVNFLLRPYQVVHGIEVDVIKEDDIPISVYYNNKLIEDRHICTGRSFIHLPDNVSNETINIYIEIHSEGINNLANQNDSWVKMRLVE